MHLSGNAEGAYVRACSLLETGRAWEALRLFKRLHEAEFRCDGLLAKLGWASLAVGEPTAAEVYMHEAVASAPGDWELHFGLGEALRARDPQAAKTAYSAALAASPDNLHCLINLCVCDLAGGNAIEAEMHARRAVRISEGSSAAWINLGVALLLQDRVSEAHDAFLRGDQCEADTARDDTDDLNRGVALRLLGRTHEAIEYYERALPEHPSAVAHGHYALALLTAGRFQQGWDQYAFRWLEGSLVAQRAKHGRPEWTGQDLRGKTIAVRCEQGAGDVFQFIRYLPLVKARGATVLLELRPGLGVLAESFPGVEKAIRPGEHLPEFDFYVDLMSLPRVFGTTLYSIPAVVPYLHVPAHIRAAWRDRLGTDTTLRAGLVWSGDPQHARDRQRSIPLATLAPIVEVEGVRWFSLQKGAAAIALKQVRFDRTMVDLGPDLYEYADTAAAIESLDLVVTVDTSVAHLAGALGKDVWVLLPWVADWRWLEGREDSPWYPTTRLFRQRAPDDWSDVIQRVAGALEERVAAPGAGRPPPGNAALGKSDSPGHPEPERPDAIMRTPGISRACRTRYGMIQLSAEQQPESSSVEHYGEYLQLQVDVLGRLVAPGTVVLEIGAGIGLHAIALARRLGPEGQILVVERSKALRRILKQNLAANGVKQVSEITRAAEDHSLDDLKFEQLDVLKVNEAAQVPPILDGSPDTLWRLRPTLFLAQETQPALRPQAQRIGDFGYRCWSFESPLFNPKNFNRRGDDIFPGRLARVLLAVPEERDSDAAIAGVAGLIPVSIY